MPLREQSRIKADTVAEECTCEECPAPAPEPSAPPAGVPVCKAWCGKVDDDCQAGNRHFHRFGKSCWGRGQECWCSVECMDIKRPFNPPPSDPVTVATGVPVAAHPAPFAHDCDIVPDDDDDVPTAEECAETVKRLGIDVPAWAADIRARVAAVATGGVPTGYRLGDGWQAVDPAFKWVCTSSTHDPLPGAVAWRHADIGHAVHYQYCCEPCAIEAGAIVPIDTARPVPPGPAQAEGHADDDVCKLGLCPACNPPAAPASEPAVRPLRIDTTRRAKQFLVDISGAGNITPMWQFVRDLLDEVLSFERDAARADAEQLRAKLTAARSSTGDYSGEDWMAERLAAVGRSWTDAVKREREKLDASHAEVEYLRAQLVEEQKRRGAIYDATSAARRHMDSEVAQLLGKLAAAIKRLPLDTGTATDTGGEAAKADQRSPSGAILRLRQDGANADAVNELERCIDYMDRVHAKRTAKLIAQADAIKAAVALAAALAVDKERKRCLAWVSWVEGAEEGGIELRAHIRSGEDAPGAVGK